MRSFYLLTDQHKANLNDVENIERIIRTIYPELNADDLFSVELLNPETGAVLVTANFPMSKT
jgi:hypothetical protein